MAPNLYFDGDKAAIRISTLFSYGTKVPDKITIVPCKIGERTCIDNYVSDKKSIYLFDKGYFKYSWYDEMSDNQIRFVTCQQSSAIMEEYICTETEIDNLYEYVVTMGSYYSKNKTRYKYREILYFDGDSDYV